MSAAVGAWILSVPLPAGGTRVTRGFPSTVFTVVGSYCSAFGSQGRSSEVRSMVTGA